MFICKDLENVIDKYDPINVECCKLLIDPKEILTYTYEIFKKLVDTMILLMLNTKRCSPT